MLLRIAVLLTVFSQLTTLVPLVPGQQSKNESAQVFAYDRSVAFDLKEESSKDQDGITIRDVNYAPYTPERGRVKAYLIKPAGKGPFAGVLFFHWLGEHKSDRTEYLDEAVALAKQGTASLLFQGYFPWAVPPKDGDTDRQRVIDQTIEVRRAVDLLLTQPGVDRKRIGYVGHDYGAMYGANLAGVDKRVKTFIFMAPIGSFNYWSLAYWLKKQDAPFKEAYRQALRPVDPVTHISHAAPTTILFQFANQDEHIPKAEAMALFDVASEPKEMKWYEAKHDLNIDAAQNDRREWLTRHLSLKPRS